MRAHAARFSLCLLLLGLVVSLGGAASAVTIDYVTIGDAAEACDTQSQGCFGFVESDYDIGKYEVTNAQYVDMLNAVAATDTRALYNALMTSNADGGILRAGVSGSFTYSLKAGMGLKPVNFVTIFDAMRFTNWLTNGQPTGLQTAATTEDGSYTFTGASTVGPRNALSYAHVVIPTENEWYKAAYYDGTAYFDYPAGSDTQSTCTTPGATANTANCDNAVGGGDPTDVGSYTGSASPYGTFDQGGNIFEWTETITGGLRVIRGGSFGGPALFLDAAEQGFASGTTQIVGTGFRVALVPEPGTGLLLMMGLVGLSSWRKRS